MHIHMMSCAHYFITLSVLQRIIYLSEIIAEKLCLHSECLRVSSEFAPCPHDVFGVQCGRQLSAWALSVFALSPHKKLYFLSAFRDAKPAVCIHQSFGTDTHSFCKGHCARAQQILTNGQDLCMTLRQCLPNLEVA